MRTNEIAKIVISVGYQEVTGLVVLTADVSGWTPGDGRRVYSAQQSIPSAALIRSSEPVMEMAFNSVRSKCLEYLKSAEKHSERQEMFKVMNQKPTQEP